MFTLDVRIIEKMTRLKKPIYPSLLSYLAFEDVILLPDGILPMHIKDPVDLLALEQALGQNRFVAVVQAQNKTNKQQVLYKVGCLGQVVTFSEGSDGSIFVLIKGIQRLVVEGEVGQDKAGPLLKVKYPIAAKGTAHKVLSAFDKDYFLDLMKDFMKDKDLHLNWEELQTATDESLVISLAMSCPFKGAEKQAILESNSLNERLSKMTAFLEVARLKSQGGAAYIQ